MSIIDNAKEISQLIKKYNDTELYQKITDLSYEIFDIKEENLSLKEKIKELEKKDDIEKNISFYNDIGYIKNKNTKIIYCTKCWDDEKKLIKLHHKARMGKYTCPKCKHDFY